MPQIEVTFDIDANGIVHVGAKDLGTGNEQTIEIKASSGLSDDEITNMVRDAESHADEDRRLRRVADARNQAEARIHEAERQLKDNGDKVDDETAPRPGGRHRGRQARPPRATTPTTWRPRPAA